MKRILFVMFVVVVSFSACSTVSKLTPLVNMPSAAMPSAIAGGIDFKDGEVLCAMGSDPYREDFFVAKIVTAPSAATKNQAEVVYVHDGKKEWVNYMIPSKKAGKGDLAVGKIVFYPAWRQNTKEIDADTYRKDLWRLGRVSSVDEIFKDIVEVNGDKYYWQNLRNPDKEP